MKLEIVAIFLLFIYSSCNVVKKSTFQIKTIDGRHLLPTIITANRISIIRRLFISTFKNKILPGR